MCGRYTQVRAWSDLVRLYRITAAATLLNLPPRYPTQDVPVVRADRKSGERELVMMRWGLVPFWAKDIGVGVKMINARAETIADKPAFRHAFRQRRCLVVADGFYEWQAAVGRGRKQPYFITIDGDRPFAFAGLWEAWSSPEGQRVESCTIVVTSANDQLRPVHDRMPVILEPEVFDRWLDTTASLDQAKALLEPYAGEVTLYPVSHLVNAVGNDDPACVLPVDAALTLTGDRARQACNSRRGNGPEHR
jgi:putative SOS response-associated peptidase YedK